MVVDRVAGIEQHRLSCGRPYLRHRECPYYLRPSNWGDIAFATEAVNKAMGWLVLRLTA